MPAVKFFARLDLNQICLIVDGHYLTTWTFRRGPAAGNRDRPPPEPARRFNPGMGNVPGIMNRYMRSRTLCLLLIAGMLTGIAGCRPDTPAADLAPVRVLRVGSPMQVRQANPVVDYGYSILAMLMTHDTLVRFDARMHPVAQLAEAWRVSADGLQWEFTLRGDARWHDGRPVEPSDVAFTFHYLAAHQGASGWIQELVREIRIDGARVTFLLNRPCSRFLINGGFVVRILPRHIWQQVADPFKPGAADVTLGCGPFVFSGLDVHTGRIAFEKNPAYYGPPAAVARVEMLLGQTFDTLTLALLRGEIDLFYKYASGYQAAHVPRLSKDPRLRLHQADAMGIPAALGFNGNKAPGADPGFRRAVAMALDFPRLTRSLLGPADTRPGAGFIPPAFANHVDSPMPSFDPVDSRQLLQRMAPANTDRDGDGNRPQEKSRVLKLLARSDLEGTDPLLPILSYNLRQVGLSVDIERVDLAGWIDRVGKSDFDLVLFRTTPLGMEMHAGYATGYFDSRRSGGGTLANIADPYFHRLCDQMLATNDKEALQALQCRIQRYYADQLPAIALCWGVNTYPALDRWQGLTVNQIEGGLLNRQTLTGLRLKKDGP